jgi:hypothetical protein
LAEGGDGSRWWHSIAAASLAGVGTFVASHWGGATHDDVNALKAEIGALHAELNQEKLSCAGSSDLMKKYVDQQIAAAERRLTPMKKRRTTGETSGQ